MSERAEDDLPEAPTADHDSAAGSASEGSLFIGVSAVCEEAVRTTSVDGAAVAIPTGTPRVRELVHATDTIAEHLDELQFTVGEGPCL